jgi:zinc protease
MIGFWHDRDVVVYYGDPKWEVRLQSAGEQDYTVTSERKGKRYIVTITTGENFSMEKMRGDKFKQEHVLDLPFSYIFPERLNNPQLVGNKWGKAVVDENFMLLYDVEFAPSSTYEIVIKTK